ncbi:MAG TPA: RHS repeat-associated core domain-containing protein [Terriglobia bacterium]|nr:RHS repeat-associated core domain-containing protein [Terriglobia bacterium]
MTAAGNATFTYDANGNTTSKTDSSGTTTYTWDFENRLTSVTLPNGHVQNYKYDPFGRRIFKDSPTKTRVFVYDGDNIAERLDASGKATERFTQALGIDEPLATYASGIGTYYEADGLGSITSLTNASGNIANTYEYDSFGQLTGSNESVSNTFRYAGREDDGETKLYYYRARYYDPSTGRFLSEDPIRMGGGVDFYAYVRNNPVVRNDPTGLIHQAWTEEPFDGRLHSDPGAGLEVLCTNPKTLARDIGWLEHSIAVRSEEIDRLGQDADKEHIDRLYAEEATLTRCKNCRDRDKKPEQILDPTWEAVKGSVKKLGNEIIDYCSLHPVTCVAIGIGIASSPLIRPPIPE